MKLAIAVLLASVGAASAADIAVQPVKKPNVLAYNCTQTACSGFYIGPNLQGIGSSITDINGGVPASAFTSGGGLGVDVGYRFWNGQFYFGGELFGDYNALNLGTGNGFKNTWMAGQVGKFGIGFSGLFGGAATAPTVPSQTPVPTNVPASLAQAMLSPYVAFGAVERPWGTGWAVGGGIDYVLAANWNLDLMYLNVNYNNANINPNVTQQNENVVKIGLHYHL